MTGFPIGTISDLSHVASLSICFRIAPHNEKSGKKAWPVRPITMVEVSFPSTPTMDQCRSFKMSRKVM